MTRLLPRLVTVLMPLLAATVLGTAALTGASSGQARAAPASTAVVSRYCYNWDFLNNTGQDATDLHIRLKGIRIVGEVYTGALNPFGSPDATSGYDVAADVYNLNFSGGVVPSSGMAHIGICTDSPALMLDITSRLPPFYWTMGGQPIPPAPLAFGLMWDWQSRRHLRLTLHNSQQVTVTLTSLNLLAPGEPFGLDDLNPDTVSTLPLATMLIEDIETLPPLSDSFFDVFFDLAGATGQPGHAQLLGPLHPYVLVATGEAQDDAGNTFQLFSQTLSPPINLYLPLVLRQ